ncbi:very short patch repair endonuclease [Aeromicrobium panaciterrae]|uniref:very short patch repair endonuclease n=1 Tax=Aeromicrobium panaciterrae TaxID=363861 RepID=UPI0031D2F965
MIRQRSRDTLPELELRHALHGMGYRYRVNFPVPGMPRRSIDVAFTRSKVAVFVDGCFWHGCPVHATWPKTNADWWKRKILRNRARDSETSELLRSQGWTVVRIWEHVQVSAAVQVIESIIDAPARRIRS